MPNASSDVSLPGAPLSPQSLSPEQPIGIFDSGLGGLSVLRHIRNNLPYERLLYVADSAFAPYGEKTEAAVVERSLAIADFLAQRGVKALVVACNTATAAAIKGVRERYPQLLVVGVEPGLKPAAAITQTRTIGVLATERTLASRKFAALQEQISAASGVRFILQACVGLADQVEKGALRGADTALLVQRYVAPLIEQGADTLVLGCTHYPFVQPLIEASAKRAANRPITIIDTGAAVARQLMRLLAEQGLQRPPSEPTLEAFTSGSTSSLARGFATLLDLGPPIALLVPTASFTLNN